MFSYSGYSFSNSCLIILKSKDSELDSLLIYVILSFTLNNFIGKYNIFKNITNISNKTFFIFKSSLL